MISKFELIQGQEQPVLSIRTRTSVEKLPQEIGRAYGVILEYMKELGEELADFPFVAYYNLDMENLDVEIGFPVCNKLAGKGEIQAGQIAGGKFASCVYKGPYKEMGPVYDGLSKWITENGYTPTGVAYEFYYNSPLDVPEKELLTKIVFPIK